MAEDAIDLQTTLAPIVVRVVPSSPVRTRPATVSSEELSRSYRTPHPPPALMTAFPGKIIIHVPTSIVPVANLAYPTVWNSGLPTKIRGHRLRETNFTNRYVPIFHNFISIRYTHVTDIGTISVLTTVIYTQACVLRSLAVCLKTCSIMALL